MVLRRCAMVMMVDPLKLARMAFWMKASVSPSTLAVASSSTSTLGLHTQSRISFTTMRGKKLGGASDAVTRAACDRRMWGWCLLPEQGTCHAQKLALPNAPVLPRFRHPRSQAIHAGHNVLQPTSGPLNQA